VRECSDPIHAYAASSLSSAAQTMHSAVQTSVMKKTSPGLPVQDYQYIAIMLEPLLVPLNSAEIFTAFPKSTGLYYGLKAPVVANQSQSTPSRPTVNSRTYQLRRILIAEPKNPIFQATSISCHLSQLRSRNPPPFRKD